MAALLPPLGHYHNYYPTRRWFSAISWTSQLAAIFARVAGNPHGAEIETELSSPGVHIIRSASRNPFANLAVEQRLLECAHPDVRLLFLYRNGPCVVIGRNQNPWAEVNLGALGGGIGTQAGVGRLAKGCLLVRRRSGGGTVYHDAGNANWSVLGPSAGFDRDRHAAMVARALQRLGAVSARVNERHDIVVDGCYGNDRGGGTFKVSGSAYKLTRRHALHHGTCLLTSDLAAVSAMLSAPPAAPFIKARGVASVRSPVCNIGAVAGGEYTDAAAASVTTTATGVDPFADAVVTEFQDMYGPADSDCTLDLDATDLAQQLAKGYEELMSPNWIFAQTPQFTFSTHPTPDDPRKRPHPPPDVPPNFRLSFTARHGRLQDVVVTGLSHEATDSSQEADVTVSAALHGQLLYQIHDWPTALRQASPRTLDRGDAVGRWLNHVFGVNRVTNTV